MMMKFGLYFTLAFAVTLLLIVVPPGTEGYYGGWTRLKPALRSYKCESYCYGKGGFDSEYYVSDCCKGQGHYYGGYCAPDGAAFCREE